MLYVNLAGYLCIPLSYLVHFWLLKGSSSEPIVTFILAGLGVVPLAHLMGQSTEHLSERAGPTWGGLLNATFGNAAELIIGFIALYKGLNDVVRASLTGSILGNLLLVAGAAMLVGGWRRERQNFSKASSEINAGMMVVTVAAMLLPAMFHITYHWEGGAFVEREHALSFGTSIILLLVYGLGLLFTLRTHSHLFSAGPAMSPEEPAGISGLRGGQWTVRKSVTILLIASAGVAIVAELLVGSAEKVAERLSLSPVFVGVILLAIIGNAAEHSTAVMLAHRNDMDTAMTISFQSSTQIALFVTPALVLASSVMVAMGAGHTKHLDLAFTPMEVVAVMLTVSILVVLTKDGSSNWFEGVLLLALYAILGIAFFYIPTAQPAH